MKLYLKLQVSNKLYSVILNLRLGDVLATN